MASVAQVENKFKELFSGNPLLLRAPGRINLVGEHTDYNLGFVLPAAIDKEIYFAVAKNNTNNIGRIFSFDYDEFFETDIRELKPVSTHWSNYLTGVVYEILKPGKPLTGFDCVFGGNIPIGAGLSSSAAVECGLGFALNEIFNLTIEKMELAKLCQRSEHNFPKVKCGMLDQFSCLFGKRDHVMKLDCKSFEYEYIPFKFTDHVILLFNTNVSHSLADTGHLNERFESCYLGTDAINKLNPRVTCMRDATMNELLKVKEQLNIDDFNRCRYIIEETERFEKATKFLLQQNIAEFGRLMFQTHEGLSKLYGISCYELDLLVDYAKQNGHVAGARMMGGGYGGCTINIVRKEFAEMVRNDFKKYYEQKTNLQLSVYDVMLVDGVNVL